MEQAMAEADKVAKIVVRSEEKAGLPDSSKTTAEPITGESSTEDQEGMAFMIMLISIVVLCGTCSAGWSIWMARGNYAKNQAADRETEDDSYGPLKDGEQEAEAEDKAAPEGEGEAAAQAP